MIQSEHESVFPLNREVVRRASRLPLGVSPHAPRGRDARADSRDGCPTTAQPAFLEKVDLSSNSLSVFRINVTSGGAGLNRGISRCFIAAEQSAAAAAPGRTGSSHSAVRAR